MIFELRTDRARSACLLFAVALAGCRGSAEQQAAASAPEVMILQPGDLAIARDTALSDAVILTGTLQPYRQTEVRAQVPGTVAVLRADRGDAVRHGQVLAEISAAGIRSAAEAARAGVAAAEAGEALARRQFDSAKRLYEQGALSAIELQGSQAAYDAAAGQLAAARAQLAGASEAAGYASVIAPFAGMVSKREVNLGEAVNPGQALFTVVDARILELAGEVAVQTAVKLRPGARVEFDVEVYPGERFAGRVARVEPVADPSTRRVGVYLQLPNDGRLVGGVFATGRVELGERTRGLTVPLAALRGAADSLYVWVVRRGGPVRQPVQLVTRDEHGSLAQVRGALRAGDTLVVAPGELKEGVQLRITRGRAEAGGER